VQNVKFISAARICHKHCKNAFW